MKIKIISNGEPIRVYHDAMDVIYNQKQNTAAITKTKERFVIEKRDLDWVKCPNDSDVEEIHAILYVKNSDYNHGKAEELD